MLGVIANALAVVLGGGVGILFKKGIPERISSAVMSVLGVFVLCIGIMGIFKGKNPLVLLVSIVLGTIVGELIDIDAAVTSLGETVERKTHSASGGFAQGFVTSTLLFCVGAMGVVGSIQAGTTGDTTTLYAKSVLDLVAALMLSVTMGPSVLFSAVSVLVFEGGITLLAGVLAPVLTDTMIAEMTCVGSLMIIVLGFNIMGLTKFKVANYLPAMIFAPFVSLLFAAIGMG